MSAIFSIGAETLAGPNQSQKLLHLLSQSFGASRCKYWLITIGRQKMRLLPDKN
jgi:hypothetical protein